MKLICPHPDCGYELEAGPNVTAMCSGQLPKHGKMGHKGYIVIMVRECVLNKARRRGDKDYLVSLYQKQSKCSR